MSWVDPHKGNMMGLDAGEHDGDLNVNMSRLFVFIYCFADSDI